MIHVSPSGVKRKCVAASVMSCPFESKGYEHFETEAEASAYVEELLLLKYGGILPSRGSSEVVGLDSIMSVSELRHMISEGFVNCKSHEDDPSLKILCYSHLAQIKGKWNDVTRNARGLIIKSELDDFSDAVVVQRPFKKFFTLSQMSSSDGGSAWALGDDDSDSLKDSSGLSVESLDFNAPASVTDKMDGSLGVLYMAPDGKLAFSTKGSFHSEQAVMYTKMLRDDLSMYSAARRMMSENPGKTFLFELVGKRNVIVLSYDEDDIVLLGAVDKSSGANHPHTDFKSSWEANGLSTAEVMEANSLQEALLIPDRENREGVVVTIHPRDPEKQAQIKIKQDDYVALHRIATNLNYTKVFAQYESGTLSDLRSKCPDHLKKVIDDTVSDFEGKYARLEEEISVVLQKVNLNESDKKTFAMEVQAKVPAHLRKYCFNAHSGRDNTSAIWSDVKKLIKSENKLEKES